MEARFAAMQAAIAKAEDLHRVNEVIEIEDDDDRVLSKHVIDLAKKAPAFSEKRILICERH